MIRQPEPWYRNPFLLGSIGLLLLVGGYVALSSGEGAASPLYLGGRLVFLVGFLVVVAAGVIWFVDARRPEVFAEDDEEADDDDAEDDSHF